LEYLDMNINMRNHVNVSGSAGPTLVYGHGFGCNQSMWDAITPAFATHCRQVLFDYVGSGKSDPAAFQVQRYSSLDGYAQDLLEVCDAQGITEDAVFVGHSVSCSIGMLASIARPRLFKHMVLVGPNPCFVNEGTQYTGGFARSDLQELLDLMDRNFIGWANYLAPVVAGQSAPTSVRLSESFCSTDPLMAHTFAKTTFFADNRDDVAKVTVPCLILQHRHDTLAPLAVGDYLHAHLQHSTLQVLDVVGHCAHMSHPELVIDAIRTVLGPA
jgi:sigma-B regulation protein RsbQ